MAYKKTVYSEKLKDPRWQKKRLEILNRDNWTCKICGSTEKQLHAHHPQYDSEINNPWEYDDDLIITLCESCHSEEHENMKGIKEYILLSIVKAGFNTTEKMSKFSDMLDQMRMGLYIDNPNAVIDKELFLTMIESYWSEGA